LRFEQLTNFINDTVQTAAHFGNGEPDFPKRLSKQKAEAVRKATAKIEAAKNRPELKQLK
jgi:hypothetical protein